MSPASQGFLVEEGSRDTTGREDANELPKLPQLVVQGHLCVNRLSAVRSVLTAASSSCRPHVPGPPSHPRPRKQTKGREAHLYHLDRRLCLLLRIPDLLYRDPHDQSILSDQVHPGGLDWLVDKRLPRKHVRTHLCRYRRNLWYVYDPAAGTFEVSARLSDRI